MFNTKYFNKLLSVMKKDNVDAMLIAPSTDLQFLMGFSPHMDERFQGLFILNNGRYFYIVPKLNREEIESVLGKDACIYAWDDGEGYLGKVKNGFTDFDLISKTIGVNSSTRGVNILDIKETLEVNFINGNEILEEIRIIKDEEEIENLKKAAQLADEVFNDIIKFIRPGIQERDIKDKIEELFMEKGADGLSFNTIVASGPNSSKPHYNAYSRYIQEKDVIILDFGCKYKGLCSDMSRTVFVGGISDEEKEIYDIVYRSNEAGEKFVKEGIAAESVDKVSRDIIKNAGYGEYFINRLGHGIGYSVHEAPDIKGGNKRILEKGMAFSIEPGIYIPGKFGMRIEDIVVIGKNGPEVINKSSKEIIIV